GGPGRAARRPRILPAGPRPGPGDPRPAQVAGVDRGGAVNAAVRLACAVAALALAGCATRPASAPAAVTLTGPALAAATARVEIREALVAEAGGLAFSGRVALSKGWLSGCGRSEWWPSWVASRVGLLA